MLPVNRIEFPVDPSTGFRVRTAPDRFGKPFATAALNQLVGRGTQEGIRALPLAYQCEDGLIADSPDRSEPQPGYE
jgi:hypothetical protein